MKSKIVIFSFLTIFLTSPLAYSKTKGVFTRVGDVFHMEFLGKSNWSYQLKKTSSDTFELQVPKLDQSSIIELKTANVPLLESVKVNDNGPDDSHVLLLKFKSDIVESFDYQTDEPSRLIIDFYEEAEKKEAREKEKQKKKTELAKKQKKIKRAINEKIKMAGTYKKVGAEDRKPAGDELIQGVGSELDGKSKNKQNLTLGLKRGVYDAGDPDYERFKIPDYQISEEAIIASKNNIYIRFPMLKMGSSNLNKILNNPPEYRIKANPSKENKEARFLHTLYKNDRRATFLKTFRYFKDQYPDSIYNELLSYMAADIHYRLWEQTKDTYHYNMAKKIYKKTLLENPNSPLKERITLLIDYVELEQGKALETVQNFLRFIKEFPQSEEIDRAKHALAEGYFLLNKFETALEVYKDLEKTARQKEMGVEATYRRGDVFFKMKKYDRAIAEYLGAIKKHPQYEGWFANAHYNLGESYFWTGEYKKSLDHYIRYLKLFPNDSHNSYAMTRVGEVLEILGADKSKIMGAFLESYFRFENTQGGKIARIRMLTQQMKSMKEKEISKTLKELKQISESVDLPKMEEFTTLMITDGYRRRKEYDKAINQLISYYQKNPTSVSLTFFKTRIVGNIADSINEKINNDNYFDTLKISGRYGKTWLRNSERIDLEYFKGRAFELAGVYDEAHERYEKVLKRLLKIKGTREHLVRKVREHLPTIDKIRLRLANTSLNLRKYSQAYNYLLKIDDATSLKSSEKVEMIEVSSRVFTEKGMIDRAKQYLEKLVDTWKDEPEMLSSAYLRLSELQMQTKDYLKAEISANRVIELTPYEKEKFNGSQERLSQAMEIKAKSLVAQGKEMAGVEIYLDLISKFESKVPMGSVRYTTGEILFEKDDLKGAQKIWQSFQEKESPFYKKLAGEKLRQLEWQNNYKRYNDRIPAMSNFK